MYTNLLAKRTEKFKGKGKGSKEEALKGKSKASSWNQGHWQYQRYNSNWGQYSDNQQHYDQLHPENSIAWSRERGWHNGKQLKEEIKNKTWDTIYDILAKKRWVKKKDIKNYFEDPSISKAQKIHTIKQQIPITKNNQR